jgi:hypothetical protein
VVRFARVTFALCLFAVVALAPARAFAQADEIQVYDGGLAPKGIFTLTIHNNFIAKGQTIQPFPGSVAAHESFNGVSEWALGVTNWFEAGLYLPLYSHDQELGWGVNGAKLRALFAVPDADNRRFFYGANFEFSYNATRWDSTRFTSEIRPIIGWHLGKVDVVANPIVDTAYDGLGNMTFVPAFRLVYNVSDAIALGGETYSDFGPFNDFLKGQNQVHQIYGVMDFTGKWVEFQAGVGFGLTDASDDLTFKTIFAFNLNKKPVGWVK